MTKRYSPFKVKDHVSFLYYDEGKLTEEAGTVDRIYANGQFIVVGSGGSNPRRHEMCAIIDLKVNNVHTELAA